MDKGCRKALGAATRRLPKVAMNLTHACKEEMTLARESRVKTKGLRRGFYESNEVNEYFSGAGPGRDQGVDDGRRTFLI